MIRILSGMTIVAALGVSGCAATHQQTSAAPPDPAASPLPPPSTAPGPPPPPQALADVMYRLADPAVPGTAKLSLVQDAGPSDGAALDAFATALRDSGLLPIVVSASDIRWSDTHPGDVVATIKITGAQQSPKPDNTGEFAFPMEFRPNAGGWQLTRDTAEELLAFGNARNSVLVLPAPTPTR